MPRKQQEILGGVQEETSKDTKREQESRGCKEEKEAWQGERIDFISCTTHAIHRNQQNIQRGEEEGEGDCEERPHSI